MLDQLIGILAGIVIGFSMAVPVGPLGLIVFQRSIVRGQLMGLVTGIGGAFADGFLASIGAFGIKMILEFMVKEEPTLRLVGGIILILIGLFGVFAKYKPAPMKNDSAITYIEHFFSGIVLSITNPITALSFFFIFTQIGPRLGIQHSNIAISLVMGVMFGSLLWWILLTTLATFIGHKIKHEHISLMNQCFGIIITLIGMAFLISVIF
jgi:threonine/homoserine/homoserine lactone efflux protein